MDTLVRALAIFVEVLLLAGMTYSVLAGARLAILDLGIGPKYRKIITMAVSAVGVLLVFFFAAHLITFYPSIAIGR